MKVKVAMIQPVVFKGDFERNLEMACTYLDEAATTGAKIACFAEGYPGPSASVLDSPREPLMSKAKQHGMYVIYGAVEKAEGKGDMYYLVEEMLGPDGSVVGKYRRTTPKGPYLYPGWWGFTYKEAGPNFPVFDTGFGKVGILVCSEVYVPELSRVLALNGAEIVFLPAGGLIDELGLLEGWQTLIRARAIENLMYTATCQNLYGLESGVGIIAGPEGILAKSDEPGVIAATLDLDRIHWLREEEETVDLPKRYRAIPGTLRWRRPELYRGAGVDW